MPPPVLKCKHIYKKLMQYFINSNAYKKVDIRHVPRTTFRLVLSYLFKRYGTVTHTSPVVSLLIFTYTSSTGRYIGADIRHR
jgi:hypothetical protein